MFINDYVPEEYKKGFDCSDGEHSVRIGAVRVCNAKSGNQMIEVALKVDDLPEWYIERYVAGEYFNKNITRFFDAFGIQRGNFNFESWKGAKAVAFFAHEQSEYTDSYGNTKTSNKAVLKYFVLNENCSVNSNTGVVNQTMVNMNMQPASQIQQKTVPVTQTINNNGFVEDIPF